jgi:hypothetical protein
VLGCWGAGWPKLPQPALKLSKKLSTCRSSEPQLGGQNSLVGCVDCGPFRSLPSNSLRIQDIENLLKYPLSVPGASGCSFALPARFGLAAFSASMEILLNTFWLSVAIAAFLFWRAENYRSVVKGRSTTPQGITALICALILLFPVISLTDDLHAEMAVMEDSSGTAVRVRVLSPGDGHWGKFPFPPLIAPRMDSFRAPVVVFRQAILPTVHRSWRHAAQAIQGRAPPA